MVLEALINPFLAKKRPFRVFFIGLLYSFVALFLSYIVFQEYASLILVFLITMGSIPLFYYTIKHEEHFDVLIKSEKRLLKEHGKVLFFLMLLFFGITTGLVLAYLFLPTNMVNHLFSTQTKTILNINNQLSGNYSATGTLLKIILNNIRVLIFSTLFSFLYGMGAIFILAWNSSVIAVAIGNLMRSNMARAVSTTGFAKLASYLNIFSAGVLRYAIHGIPEVLAYFIGGLAGGILSVAMIRKDLIAEKKERILFDTASLLAIAVAVLIIAGILEVYVTPILYKNLI